MQKQTIYTYLQRSLVKILSQSTPSNKYKSTVVKPLNAFCTSFVSHTKPIKKPKKLVPLPTQVALQNKTLNFYRKVNTDFIPFLLCLKGLPKGQALGQVEHQPGLTFTCKFYLISFIRPRFGVLIFKCDGGVLLTFAKQKKSQATKQKLIIKLNQSLNNDQLLYCFRAKLLDIPFYSQTICCNKKRVACPSCFKCCYCSTCPTHREGQSRTSTAKKVERTKALLLANSFDQRLCSVYNNSAFYGKQLQLVFRESFYKRKGKDYRKTFHNLFHFFGFFSFPTNKKFRFFNSAELAEAKQINFTRYAQQALYLHKIYCSTCCFQLLCFIGPNMDSIDTLDFLRNKTKIPRDCLNVSFISKRHQILFFHFQILYFLTIILYYAIKYIKQFKKQIDEPFEPALIKSNSIYKFNKTSNFNFLSFKPFFCKLVIRCSAFNSPYFFLMRPLFSLTRLDTFFICESLKLPIYPDKSNLRIDFLRNRIRKQILPAIRILLNPQFDTILCKFYE